MNQIIPAILVALCIVAGGVGGHLLKSQAAGSTEAGAHSDKDQPKDEGSHDAATDDHGGSDHGEKSTKSQKQGGHGDESGANSSDVIYYKFTREFVVPIMEGGRVKSLVIININLEADSAISQTLFSMDPKLRDNIMTTLIALSNDGVTFESFTDVDSYETLRSMILKNLANVVSSGIRNVLIVDIAKQDL